MKNRTYLQQQMLEQQATILLRKKGFTWSGRPRQAVESDQMAFERKLIIAGHHGKSTKH